MHWLSFFLTLPMYVLSFQNRTKKTKNGMLFFGNNQIIRSPSSAPYLPHAIPITTSYIVITSLCCVLGHCCFFSQQPSLRSMLCVRLRLPLVGNYLLIIIYLPRPWPSWRPPSPPPHPHSSISFFFFFFRSPIIIPPLFLLSVLLGV